MWRRAPRLPRQRPELMFDDVGDVSVSLVSLYSSVYLYFFPAVLKSEISSSFHIDRIGDIISVLVL